MKPSTVTRRLLPPREWRRDLGRQAGATWPLLLAVGLVGTVLFVAVARLHVAGRVNAYRVIDDPAPFAGLAPYTGLLSYAGVVAWCVAATIAIFGSRLLHGVRGAKETSRFLLALGVFSAWLGLDDLFIIHEEVAEAVMGFEHRHFGEMVVFLAYAVILAGCLWRYRATVPETDYLLLLLAAGLFCGSIALDVILQIELGGHNGVRRAVISHRWGGLLADVAEEVLKLAGIALWCAYLTHLVYGAVKALMRSVLIPAPGSIPRGVAAPDAVARRRK